VYILAFMDDIYVVGRPYDVSAALATLYPTTPPTSSTNPPEGAPSTSAARRRVRVGWGLGDKLCESRAEAKLREFAS
jgi:hypothetical protein